jgi:hypothetical protein
VGDSHTTSLDRKAFEGLTNAKVDMSIAYTSDRDIDAKYPDRNFIKTVPALLKKKSFDTLVLQGGCNEISNIKVKANFTAQDLKLWEEKVSQSRTKIFEVAEEALEKNKSLQKVIIVNSLPRYDPEDKDVNSVKAKLKQFGNSERMS